MYLHLSAFPSKKAVSHRALLEDLSAPFCLPNTRKMPMAAVMMELLRAMVTKQNVTLWK